MNIVTHWGGDIWLPPHQTKWYYCFAILPYKCIVSGDRMWFEMAYKAVRTITGPGTPVIEEFWFSKDQFLLMQLRGFYVH